MKAIGNIRIINDRKSVSGRALIFDEKIQDVIPEERLPFYQIEDWIDGGGAYLSAGFMELHIHGCAGRDVMDEEESSLSEIRKAILSTGVTSFLPTTMTMEFEKIERALVRIRRAMGIQEGAEILGCHLEGPFINPRYKGAQDESFILPPNFKQIEAYKDVIKMITFAPELDAKGTFIQCCKDHNIVASIGHSDATYEEAMEAIRAGVHHVTHIFNGMAPFHHRSPGVVGAAMDSEVTCELIADNIHSHEAAQRILFKVKGLEKIVLVTDAMRACLLKNGIFDLGGQQVVVDEKSARLMNGTLAGSILTINKAVKNFVETSRISLEEAVEMVTMNPARILGLEKQKGSIEAGKDADIILFDDDLNIQRSFVRGREVYRREI
ncbi:N-acetylglucosamine-6-phosphate deacetylase [Geosporobacter subterraneus DSM 17957]|uniref:N-acetylglucosamine-6-phosphate deacetylase n=1 Tax=Geosporobacter subterraneus DSM 17957 TaxID=1121919 RepID=A0A1M6F2N3_9FIRM|nr:N-acetylglucosamine-6-phosphate deacetylase [Geosporobacter subterraneus]SHI91978.1 N-acetylglucosamine-6-phosphate deacetylase [Geosporobacter subterraneus DSM 17957]